MESTMATAPLRVSKKIRHLDKARMMVRSRSHDPSAFSQSLLQKNSSKVKNKLGSSSSSSDRDGIDGLRSFFSMADDCTVFTEAETIVDLDRLPCPSSDSSVKYLSPSPVSSLPDKFKTPLDSSSVHSSSSGPVQAVLKKFRRSSRSQSRDDNSQYSSSQDSSHGSTTNKNKKNKTKNSPQVVISDRIKKWEQKGSPTSSSNSPKHNKSNSNSKSKVVKQNSSDDSDTVVTNATEDSVTFGGATYQAFDQVTEPNHDHQLPRSPIRHSNSGSLSVRTPPRNPAKKKNKNKACSNVFSCSPRRSGSKTIANVPVVVRHPTSVPVGASPTRQTTVVPVKLVRTNNHNVAPMTVRINNHHNAPVPGRNASNAPVVITRSQSTPNQQVHFQDDVEFDVEEERSLTMSALMNYAKKIEDGRLINILDKMNEESSVTADNAPPPPPTDYINIVAQKNNSNTESLKSNSTDNKDIQNSARPSKLSMRISRFRLNKKAINVTEGESGLEVEEHSICSSTALASTTGSVMTEKTEINNRTQEETGNGSSSLDQQQRQQQIEESFGVFPPSLLSRSNSGTGVYLRSGNGGSNNKEECSTMSDSSHQPIPPNPSSTSRGVRWSSSRDLVKVVEFDDTVSQYTYETNSIATPRPQVINPPVSTCRSTSNAMHSLLECNMSFLLLDDDDDFHDDEFGDYYEDGSFISFDDDETYGTADKEPDFVVVQSGQSGKWNKFY